MTRINLNKLAKFNAKDLELTLKVFEKCVECGVIVEEETDNKPDINQSELQSKEKIKIVVDEGLDIEAEAKKEAEEKQKSSGAWKEVIG